MSATLEQRIAGALAKDDVSSDDLVVLIAETETAVTTADEAATTAHELAFDLIASPDAGEARAAMEQAIFTRDRLRSVLPKLQQHFNDVLSHEEYARWVAQYEAVKIKRDAAAEELRTIYPEIATKLTDLLLRIETIDREVKRVRSAKPFDAKEANGDGRWLLETELTARGLDDFGVHDLKILQDLKLPNFSEPTKLIWPPHRPIDWSSVVPARPHRGADWWKDAQEEDDRKRAEATRLEAEHQRAEARNRELPARAADERRRGIIAL
jgi:hypothetical protein